VSQQIHQTLVYRRRAAEFEELAARADAPKTRERYLRLAREWRHLADSSDGMSMRWGGGPRH
jgi:hypothetical protein